MYRCNLCERSFSRKQDLTQHHKQLHSDTKHSRTLSWVQNQNLNLNANQQQKPLQILDNNIWNDIDIFSQVASIGNRQINEKSDDLITIDEKENDSSQDNNYIEDDNLINEYYETTRSQDDDNDDCINEYYEITRSQDNEIISSIASSEDFHGVGLADAYNDLNSDPEQILWPSETYKEFMMAVTQFHLSNAAGDAMLRILGKYCTDQLPGSTRKGHVFIDNMDIKGLRFKEKELITFEKEVYKLHYRPIYDAIKSLVSNSDLSKDFLFDYEEQWEPGLDGSLVRVYSEQNTANWWRERYSPFSKILAVMIYIDGTALDALGRKSEYPIFLTLGNILNLRRNLPDAKVLIGFLPHLTTRDNKVRNSKEFKQKQRDLKHCALKHIVDIVFIYNAILILIYFIIIDVLFLGRY